MVTILAFRWKYFNIKSVLGKIGWLFIGNISFSNDKQVIYNNQLLRISNTAISKRHLRKFHSFGNNTEIFRKHYQLGTTGLSD